jgi:hypothetical protein
VICISDNLLVSCQASNGAQPGYSWWYLPVNGVAQTYSTYFRLPSGLRCGSDVDGSRCILQLWWITGEHMHSLDAGLIRVSCSCNSVSFIQPVPVNQGLTYHFRPSPQATAAPLPALPPSTPRPACPSAPSPSPPPSPPARPPSPSPPPPKPSPPPPPASAAFTCSGKPDGLYADPKDCSKYIQCATGTAYSFTCPNALYFNPQQGYCDHPANVACTATTTSSPPPATSASPSPPPPKATSTSPPPPSPVLKSSPPPAKASPPPRPSPPAAPFTCSGKADGYYADPSDCAKFYQCGNGIAYSQSCPTGLYFNTATNQCDWPSNVACNAVA